MLVRELIEVLQRMPQEEDVRIIGVNPEYDYEVHPRHEKVEDVHESKEIVEVRRMKTAHYSEKLCVTLFTKGDLTI